MKKIIYIIYFLNLNTFIMQAQTKPETLAGEYQVRGVMEMASGLLLKPDSSFEFFFSYGALDRGGSGKWQWNEKYNLVILNTPDRHTADYALLNSRKSTEKLTTIRITDNNQYLLRYTHLLVSTPNGIVEGETDEKGFFTMPQQPVTQIELRFMLCPERSTIIKVTDSTHTLFEFRFEPWIMDIYFNNLVLKVTPEGLEGRHPLAPDDEQYTYEKLD